MVKKLRSAYVKFNIEWDRKGIFDKYIVQTLLERGDVDMYTQNLPQGTPEYFVDKKYGKFRAFSFKTLGPYLTSYIQVSLLLKKLESKYDILLTDWEFYNVGNAIINSPKSIIYFQTPERSFYDLHEYRIITKKNVFRRFLQHIWIQQKYIDSFFVRRNTNALIFGNSNNVAKRIYKTYLKHACVVYPTPSSMIQEGFVEVPQFPFKKKDFFLSVSRIVPEKRIEICIEAFKLVKEKNLVIIGWNGTKSYIDQLKKSIKGHKNIILLERISDGQRNWLYKNAIATLQTPMDEDYGVVPSESMEIGTPVIAVNEGGYTEIIKSGFNGELIVEPYSQTLPKAIIDFDHTKYDEEKIKKFVENNLSLKAFSQNFWKYVDIHRKKKGLN